MIHNLSIIRVEMKMTNKDSSHTERRSRNQMKRYLTQIAETAESEISLQSERCRLERKTHTFGKLLGFEILLRLWR